MWGHYDSPTCDLCSVFSGAEPEAIIYRRNEAGKETCGDSYRQIFCRDAPRRVGIGIN